MEMSKEKLQNLSKKELIEMVIAKDLEAKEAQENLKWLNEQIETLKKSRYGSKSEIIPNNQLSLFNEIEDIKDHCNEQEEVVVVTTKVKRRKTKEADYSKLPVKVIDHKLENKECPKCQNTMKELAPEIIDILKYQPARYYIERHIVHQYVCKECSNEIDDDGEQYAMIVSAEGVPSRLIKGSVASASVVSGIAFNKFVSGTPLYRQEQELKRKQIPLSRANMSNWLMKCSDNYLKPLYDIMKDDLQHMNHINVDETTVTVLEEKSSSRSKNYMWVMESGKWEDNQAAVYCYHANREHAFAKEMIGADYQGVIHCDGYEAYDKLEYATQVGCMAHCRRYFVEAYEVDEGSKIKNPLERKEYGDNHESFKIINHILNEIKYLFECEAEYTRLKLKPNEIYERRQNEQKARFDGLFKYIKMNQNKFTKKSKAGKAFTYALNQQHKLRNYLNDGYSELSNNRAERCIKSFVIGRKAWLFSNTISGANTSAIYYSLIESAKLNNLDIQNYLTYVLETLKDIRKPTEEDYRKVLPYSNELPEQLKCK